MNIDAVPKCPVVPPCTQAVSATADAPCAAANRKWILIATILGSSIAFMDGSVVNVALPTLQARFSATSGGIQWIVQSYALFGAALLLPGGSIGDRYGRKRTYLSGIALFALASAGCAASVSLAQLIAARAVQGIGAALLIPQGLSILSASFPADDRGRAIGTWSAWTSVFASLGPVAGGWLIQLWSWRLIFLVNLPLAFLVFALSPRVPESRAANGASARPLDYPGAVLATLSFAAIIYSLSFAPQFGWSDPRVVCLLALGLVLLAAFLRSQSGRSNAMMPLSLFGIPRFFAANLLTFLLYGALYGALFVIPFYLIQVRHYPLSEAGAVFIPLMAIMFFFSARVGTLIPKVGERVLLFAGAIFAGTGFAALALLDHLHGYLFSVLPGVLLLGIGMTLAVSPLTNAVMSSVPENDTGIASAVNNTLSRLAGLLAVSLLSLLLAHGYAAALKKQLRVSSLPIEARDYLIANRARLRSTPIPAGLTAEQQTEAASILDDAFLSGFRWVMLANTTAAWSGALAVLVLLRKRRKSNIPAP